MTVEKAVCRQLDLIYNDPAHRKNTRAALGREPTEPDLAKHWFISSGHTDTLKALWPAPTCASEQLQVQTPL